MGPVPPPVGGVSVHISRLLSKLKSEGYACRTVEDHRVPAKLLPFWIFARLVLQRLRGSCILHVHSGNWRTRFFATLYSRMLGIPVVVTIHSFRANDNRKTDWLAAKVMRLARHLIVTNEGIRLTCIQFGANPDKISVQHAYLHPELKDSLQPPELIAEAIANRNPLIAANAFMLRLHKGEDLYGLDMLIELTAKLKDDFRNLLLIFMLPQTGLPEYLQQCRQRIVELNIEDSFCIITEKLEFVELLRVCDLMIRPTNTDGDSLSIREALFLGVPAVCSDVVSRPPGTVLFKNRDVDDLERKVRSCLNSPAPPVTVAEPDAWSVIQSIYQELARG
jgi:glycosyltransferase involved in cell wall biosynthesis